MACSISIQSLSFPSKFYTPTSSKPLYFLENSCKNDNFTFGKRKLFRRCRAMVQQNVQGPSGAYAKEMERLSAKGSLLLAFKNAGGFEALVTGRTTELQRIDVSERIVSLERLNPTPRPTTSPYLEGRWNFEWFGSGSLGFLAAQLLLERFPPEVASLSKLDVVIKDLYATIAGSVKLLDSIESKFKMSSKLSVEGPVRMKQEMTDGEIETPKVNEESISEQLTSILQQLPVPVREAVSGGIKIPLGGSSWALERFLVISYLDDEILIARDAAGAPEVLTRLDPGPSYS